MVVSASYRHTLFLHLLACASNGQDSCWMWFCVGVLLHCWSLVFGQDSFPSTISTFISRGVGVCWKLYRSRLQVQSRPLDVARSVHNPVSQIDLTILNPCLRLGLSGGSTLQAPSNETASSCRFICHNFLRVALPYRLISAERLYSLLAIISSVISVGKFSRGIPNFHLFFLQRSSILALALQAVSRQRYMINPWHTTRAPSGGSTFQVPGSETIFASYFQFFPPRGALPSRVISARRLYSLQAIIISGKKIFFFLLPTSPAHTLRW